MGCGKPSKLKRVQAPVQKFKKDAENSAEDEKQDVPLMTTVFSNELIWKTLGRCLNVSDLKCCRLVNRKFNEMVMNETKFKDRVVLNVEKGKITSEEFGETQQSWKNISLNFPVENDLDPSNYEWLFPLLAKVEFLNLRLHSEVSSSSSSSAIIDFHPLLGRLLASCEKLNNLALEPGFIMMGSGRISAKGSETLENLEQLEILEPECRIVNQLPETEEQSKTIPQFFTRLRNVKVYKNYFSKIRMHLQGIPVELQIRRKWLEAVFLLTLSQAIVPSNRQHLRSHAFYDISNMSLNEMAPLTFSNFETPALTALEADCYNLQKPSGIASFVNYLDSRPTLEQLEITCHYGDHEENFLLSFLFNSVARRVRSLKKLKLEMALGNLSDWKFLRESCLQDLRLEDYKTETEENEWIRQVMSNLPKSIEKLYLRGASLEWEEGLQPLTEPLKMEYFARLDPQLMTELSIFNAVGLVDNQVAQFICKNLKMLRKLNLLDAQTDDEGYREIAGLKGLQFLTLRLCGISDETLKRIRFLELRYLDVTGNLETTAGGIKSAMKECPSLETVVIPVHVLNLEQGETPIICPRLKLIIVRKDEFP